MLTREFVNPIDLVDDFENPRRYLVDSNVTVEEYLEYYAEHRCEYVEGKVFRVMPITLRHEDIRDYLRLMFRYYLHYTGIGRVLGEPFVMYLPAFPNRRRQPDLFVLLNDSASQLEEGILDGPANIVIEIVSPGSVEVDYGEKLAEYEKGGVPEYWIIDYLRRDARFLRRSDEGLFQATLPDDDDFYRTPQLPQFRLHVPTLWEETLPDTIQALEQVKMMLQE